jgi:hypothetical protein
MTADGKIDRRIDLTGTLAQLVAAQPNPQFPPGTWAWVTDFGLVQWNGTTWATENPGTIAANTTVTQAAGTPVASELCNVTSTAAGAVTLPPSVAGLNITVHNISAFNVSVFPSADGTTTEKINAIAANGAIVMATNTSTSFTCAVVGQWYTVPRVPS